MQGMSTRSAGEALNRIDAASTDWGLAKPANSGVISTAITELEDLICLARSSSISLHSARERLLGGWPTGVDGSRAQEAVPCSLEAELAAVLGRLRVVLAEIQEHSGILNARI